MERAARARGRRRDRDRLPAGPGAAPRSADREARTRSSRSSTPRRATLAAGNAALRREIRGARRRRRCDRGSRARRSRHGLPRRDRAPRRAGRGRAAMMPAGCIARSAGPRRSRSARSGGAVACAVVAVGGVDGAAIFARDAEPADDDGGGGDRRARRDRGDPPRPVRAAVGAGAARVVLARGRGGPRGPRARARRSSPARTS